MVSTEWLRRIGNGESKSGQREDVYEGLPEVCREFLDEGVRDDGLAGWGREHVDGEGKEERRGERRAGAIDVVFVSGVWGDDVAQALGEGSGIELGTENFVGAVGHDGDAPVADEGDELTGLRGLDLGT